MNIPMSSPFLRPAPKPAPKPVSKPSLFEGGRQAPIKELFRQTKAPTIIPGTGGQRIYKDAHQKLLKQYLPYNKVGSFLKQDEAKTILRKMRHEEAVKGLPASRERRILEQDWNLKGKY